MRISWGVNTERNDAPGRRMEQWRKAWWIRANDQTHEQPRSDPACSHQTS